MTHDSTYAKPYLSVPSQIEQLASRGMEIGDVVEAGLLLRRVGYYRLSGYWYPFREREVNERGEITVSSRLRPGTTLDHISALYDFDRELRMLVLDAIETVEVALRFEVGHTLGRRSPFAHRDPECLAPSFSRTHATDGGDTSRSSHDEWLERFDDQESRSQEAFAAHFREKYGPHLPVWVATEVMTFGTLSQLYDGASDFDRERIALDFDLVTANGKGDIALLSNWFNHIRHVRNLCAHHSRLWNRTLDVHLAEAVGLPELAHLDEKSRRRIYGTFAVLAYLLARVKPQSKWKARMRHHVETQAQVLGLEMAAMGFPVNWKALPVWQDGYARDPLRAERALLLSELAVSTTAGMRDKLHARVPKERRSWLNYLRTRHALVSVSFGAARLFPDFQIDTEQGDIHPLIGDVNAELYEIAIDAGLSPEDADWKVLAWWIKEAPGHKAPLDALGMSELTLEQARAWFPEADGPDPECS